MRLRKTHKAPEKDIKGKPAKECDRETFWGYAHGMERRRSMAVEELKKTAELLKREKHVGYQENLLQELKQDLYVHINSK